MIKMLQYKMYPAGELRCPTTALVHRGSDLGCNLKITSFLISGLRGYQNILQAEREIADIKDTFLLL